MQQYTNLLKQILNQGTKKGDRTGVGTLSLFGAQMRFDLSKGLPLDTTRYIHYPAMIHELLWFLKGSSNTQYLNQNGITIWDKWADDNGNLGRIYGVQWRSWLSGSDSHPIYIDQIANAIKAIKRNPNSRRIIVSAWNVGELDQMNLPPCHVLFQFYVADGKLSCQFYQRSADMVVGVPYNISSYALLTMMVAKVCGLEYGDLIHTIGDAHIYLNHLDGLSKQLQRQPRGLPTIQFPKKDSIDKYAFEDFKLIGYNPHPHIKYKVAV